MSTKPTLASSLSVCGVSPPLSTFSPYVSNFLECNVRTYVHDAEGVPGVWFYSLDTDRWFAHWLARTFFHLPYFWASMGAKRTDEINYDVRRRDHMKRLTTSTARFLKNIRPGLNR